MSVSTRDVAIGKLKSMLLELPLEALAMLLDWISGASTAPDPTRYIMRRAMADASKGVSKAAVNALLAKKAKPKD